MSRDPGIRKLGRRQNSSIWSILAVFMGYSTLFLSSGVISMSRDTGYKKKWDVVKTRRFGHFGTFSWAIAQCFWVRGRFRCLVISGIQKFGRRQNSSIWSFRHVFMGYSTLFLGPGVISMSRDPGIRKLGRRQNSSIWSFRTVFVGAHCFSFRGRFRFLVTPGTRKLGRRQNSSLWSFLAVFMGYSTLFLGPGAISMSRDAGYTKIGSSSKLVDLVNSGRFYRL